jgi:hypothetical protein
MVDNSGIYTCNTIMNAIFNQEKNRKTLILWPTSADMFCCAIGVLTKASFLKAQLKMLER